MDEIKEKPHILALHAVADLYGSGKILLYSIDALSEEFQFTVILPEEGPLVTELDKRGVEVLVMPLGILRRKYFNLKGIASRISIWYRSLKQLKRVVRDRNPRIIYSNTTAVLIGAFLAKSTGITHVWHIHEVITKPRVLFRVIATLVNRCSDRVIVVSNSVYEYWKPFVSPTKLDRIYNGISRQETTDNGSIKKDLGLHSDDLLLGTIGRIHPIKGIDYFIEIAEHLKRDFNQLKFIIVGDAFPGYEYLYYEMSNQIKAKKLDDSIHYLGYRTDIPDILEEMDMFILPSTGHDSFPTVILEAMSMAVPVVATDLGGAPEMIVDGETGLLIKTGNASKAADRISSLIKDSELRKRIGKSGQIRQEKHFSRRSFDQNINDLFNKLARF